MTRDEMENKLFKLCVKRGGDSGAFSTQDYMDVCAQVYSSPHMEGKTARRHLGGNPSIRMLSADRWEMVA